MRRTDRGIRADCDAAMTLFLVRTSWATRGVTSLPLAFH
jgi:hypothetical protein